MPGALVFVVVMVLVIPVAVMLGGAVWTALMGWLLSEDAHWRAEGTPYAVDSARSGGADAAAR